MGIGRGIALLLIGGAIGVGLTMTLGVESPEENVGDWLAFVGALVGVIVTILGTLWVEHYRSTTQERRQRKSLLKSLEEMQTALTAAGTERGEVAIAEARISKIAAEQTLLEALDKFVYARHFIPTHDVNAWYAIETLQAAILRERPRIEKEKRIIEEAGNNENVFGVHVNVISEGVDRLIPVLEGAKTEVKRGLGT